MEEVKTVLPEYTSMGQILDSPIEEVVNELEKLNLTHLTNFKKMLELQYLQLEYTKDQLLQLDEGDTEDTLKGLYVLMQRVEDISKVVEELLDQRKIRD